MELLLPVAIAIGALLILRMTGVFGLPANPVAQQPGSGTVTDNLVQASQISSGYMSQIQQNSMQGSASTLKTGLQTISQGATTAVGIIQSGALTVGGIATLGAGAAIGIASMLWQQHMTRMKNATDENSAWNVIYPDWASSIQQIFQSYNAGTIDAPTCAGECDMLRQLVYQDAQKFQNQPGISWAAGNIGPGGQAVGLTNSQKIWQTPCTKNCTIGCCLFNGVIGPNTARAIALVMQQPVAIFATGQQQMVQTRSFAVPAIPPNPTYGFTGAPLFTLSIIR